MLNNESKHASTVLRNTTSTVVDQSHYSVN